MRAFADLLKDTGGSEVIVEMILEMHGESSSRIDMGNEEPIILCRLIKLSSCDVIGFIYGRVCCR